MTGFRIPLASLSGLPLLLACLVTGCATTLSPAAQRVQVAEDSQVTRCRFVSDVEGSSGFGNVAASTGIQNSKNEALEKAASIGATHVVWTHTTGYMGSTARGRAYQCD